jgi:GH24 family phage-related lysozyme (muramidase)
MRSKKNPYRDDQLALNRPVSNQSRGDPDFELKDRLKNLLVFEEGRIVLGNALHVAYKDSKGISTIGYGFNLEDGSAAGVLRQVSSKTTTALMAKSEFLTEQEAQALLFIAEDVAVQGAKSFFPNFDRMDLPRRVVLAAMVYQMGAARFGKFRRLIPAVQKQDWGSAVLSMHESQWFRSDSPKRARRMADAMRDGTFPLSAVLSSVAHLPLSRRTPGPQGPGPSDTDPIAAGPTRRSSWPFDN